jgi:uncharacterized membrane protein (DUF106 family)
MIKKPKTSVAAPRPKKNAKPKISSVGNLIKQSLSVYRDNWEKFGTLVIIPLIISFIYSTLIQLGRLFSTSFSPLMAIVWSSLSLVLLIISAVIFILAYLAQILLADNLSIAVSFRNLADQYKKAVPFFWTGLGITIVYSLAAMLGILCIIIPGIVIIIYYCFTVYEMVLGHHKMEESFGCSRQLVSSYFWPVLGRLTVGSLILWFVYMIFGLTFTAIGHLLNRLFNFTIGIEVSLFMYNIFSIFVGLVIGPLSIIYLYSLYQELKKVKEKN